MKEKTTRRRILLVVDGGTDIWAFTEFWAFSIEPQVMMVILPPLPLLVPLKLLTIRIKAHILIA